MGAFARFLPGGTLGAGLMLMLVAGSSAHAQILWEGDWRLGARAFEGIELSPGNFEVVTDPDFGPVFHLSTWDRPDHLKSRAETRGSRNDDGSNFRMEEGGEYYLGWASYWDPLPNPPGRWCAMFQIHGYRINGGTPFVFRTVGDGMLHLQYCPNEGGGCSHIWSVPLVRAQWNRFVVHAKLTRSEADGGFIELWYNGAKQTFITGETIYPASLFQNDYILTKWGVYRGGGADIGPADALLFRPRIGLTFDNVDPYQ